MFESPLLDRFTRVHPVVPGLLFGPAIVALLVTGVGRGGAAAGLGPRRLRVLDADGVLAAPHGLSLRA